MTGLVVGAHYAYRQRASWLGGPVIPVEVVRLGLPRSGKVRVRYLGGDYEGLEEWVPKQRLLCPWDEAPALLEDERRLARAIEATPDMYRTVPYEAASTVFAALYNVFGREMILMGWKAPELNLVLIPEFESTIVQLGLDRSALLSEPFAFVDRQGTYRAPYPVAERLAQEFCRRFPEAVLRYIEKEAKELQEKIVHAPDEAGRRFYQSWYDKTGVLHSWALLGYLDALKARHDAQALPKNAASVMLRATPEVAPGY